jgi:hypothetical protein
MSLIIDVNVVHKVFPIPDVEFVPLNKAITRRRAEIVYGGELRREYQRVGWFWRLLVRLDQQGTARLADDEQVDAETARLRHGAFCRSDDPHIIALARVAHVRLLASEDDDLCLDFKNGRLLSRPRGIVYRSASHARILWEYCRRYRKIK